MLAEVCFRKANAKVHKNLRTALFSWKRYFQSEHSGGVGSDGARL